MEGLPQPLTIKLNMPDKPRSAPQNAEEPMAFFISIPREFKNGTIKPPPPTPAALDAIPIKIPPITDACVVKGLVFPVFFLIEITIFAAKYTTKQAKILADTSRSSLPINKPEIKTEIITIGANTFTALQTILPSL